MDESKLKAGKDPKNGEVNVLIEIPKDSNVKYQVDEESGFMFVDRFLYTAMNFPFNYGHVPHTLAEDGDPIDVMVLCEQSLQSGVIIPCSVIGMLEMTDEAGVDTKLIAVPTKKIDPLFGAWTDINDVPEPMKNKMRHFYENYKTLEPGKWVKLKEWKDKATAIAAVVKSLK